MYTANPDRHCNARLYFAYPPWVASAVRYATCASKTCETGNAAPAMRSSYDVLAGQLERAAYPARKFVTPQALAAISTLHHILVDYGSCTARCWYWIIKGRMGVHSLCRLQRFAIMLWFIQGKPISVSGYSYPHY